MKLKYRPEVDGLRCIAVMLVVLHHLKVPGFSGGFVGVDVFFVISGYLITTIIMEDIKNDAFTFGAFYKRRVIRLAPAYFTVIFATGIVALLLMLPAELEKFAASSLYSTFFAANFYMWDAVGGYFGTGSHVTPLLHLWSLSVEEQFYLVWPVALLMLSKLIGARFMITVAIVAVCLGLIVSEYGALNFPAAAYYLMPTRAFELMIGAVLAFVPAVFLDRVPRNIRVLLGLVGLSLIVSGNVGFSEETWFPGFNALVPCTGALLLLAFVRSNDPVLGKLMAARPAAGIGKISYPAYLWHWPIIAFLNLQLVEITPLISLAVIFATFILAALTYHFIEKPVTRFRSVRWWKVVGVGFLVPAVFYSTVAVSSIHWDGFPARFDEELGKKSAAVLSFAGEMRGRCNEGPVQSPLGREQCVLGALKPSVSVLLVGDSHANHFSGMIDIMAAEAGLRGYDVTQSNTPFLIGVERFYSKGGELIRHENFSARNATIERELLTNRYDFVVLGGAFENHFSRGLFSTERNPKSEPDQRVFREAMVRTIAKIVEHSSTPVLIKGNPTFGFNVSDCTLNNIRFDLDKNCHLARNAHDEEFREWNRFVDQLTERFEQLVVIDPVRVMCDEAWCYSELGGLPLYKDSGHLNYLGSKLLGQLYIDEFGNPFIAALEKTEDE